LHFTGDGLVITLRRSKVDQEGEGRKVGIPYGSNCPVRSLKAWLGFHRTQSSTGMIIWCRRQQNKRQWFDGPHPSQAKSHTNGTLQSARL
jgi:hypothetical protein